MFCLCAHIFSFIFLMMWHTSISFHLYYTSNTEILSCMMTFSGYGSKHIIGPGLIVEWRWGNWHLWCQISSYSLPYALRPDRPTPQKMGEIMITSEKTSTLANKNIAAIERKTIAPCLRRNLHSASVKGWRFKGLRSSAFICKEKEWILTSRHK